MTLLAAVAVPTADQEILDPWSGVEGASLGTRAVAVAFIGFRFDRTHRTIVAGSPEAAGTDMTFAGVAGHLGVGDKVSRAERARHFGTQPCCSATLKSVFRNNG